MELKSGYKQTEVGVIPEDWDIRKIGDFLDFKNGLNKSKEFFGHGTPILNYVDVFKNCGLAKVDIKGKVEVSRDETRNFSAKVGDVFFTRTSEVVEEIGLTAVLLEEIDDAVFSGFLLRGRPQTSDIELGLGYRKFCFRQELVRHQIISTSSYTTRALTNGKLLSKILVPLPPTKKEQEAIAGALSDADELIASLEQLIEKKRMIKQGAMQELLTGKKRLPGFQQKPGYKQTEVGEIPEDWEVSTLGIICRTITTGKLDANAMVPNGQYRFYTCAKEHFYINNYAFDAEALLISGNGANVGYVHYYKGKFNAYQRTYILADFDCSIKFVEHFLSEKLALRISTEVNAGNTPYIVRGTLSDMLLGLPPTKAEQEAIATVLSDMDTEIEALENKLEKARKIKAGMMHNLLTGTIRLV